MHREISHIHKPIEVEKEILERKAVQKKPQVWKAVSLLHLLDASEAQRINCEIKSLLLRPGGCQKHWGGVCRCGCGFRRGNLLVGLAFTA